jgi:diacylglycerol kinase family enzyme
VISPVASIESAAALLRRLEPHQIAVAAGGDGTVGMIAGALLEPGVPELTLAILPLGTGNTMARALGILNVSHALQVLQHGTVRSVDVMRTSHPPSPVALVTISAGFEAAFIHRYSASRRHSRVWAGLSQMPIALRGNPSTMLELDGRVVLEPGESSFSVGLYNTPFYAAGIRMSPESDVYDGLGESIVYATAAAYWRTAAAALREDRALPRNGVQRRRFRSARIESAYPLQIDGEPVTCATLSVTMELGALRVLTAA